VDEWFANYESLCEYVVPRSSKKLFEDGEQIMVNVTWIHLKALRLFVESVLRYGLPVNFQAAIIKPQKKGSKRLRETLDNLYSHLNSSNEGLSKKDVSAYCGLNFSC